MSHAARVRGKTEAFWGRTGPDAVFTHWGQGCLSGLPGSGDANLTLTPTAAHPQGPPGLGHVSPSCISNRHLGVFISYAEPLDGPPLSD